MEKLVSKIKKVEYGHLFWGPYVMRTLVPDYIIKRLLKDGKEKLKSYIIMIKKQIIQILI